MADKIKHVVVSGERKDISDPNPQEQNYSLHNGTALNSKADLFKITTIGNYYSSNATITNSLSNCPVSDEPFRMICGYLLEDSDLYLMIRTESGEIYLSVSSSGAYSSWKPVMNELNISPTTTGENFGYDFHSIGTSRYADANKRSFFSIADSNRSAWKNIPSSMPTSGTVKGYREVIWMDSKNVILKVTELSPVPGRQYFDSYNSAVWIGWNTVTPQ